MMDSSKRPPHSGEQPDTCTSSIDTGILAFGSSASVNGVLKREVMNEIEESEQIIIKTRKVVEVEHKSSHELHKGRVHGHAENESLLNDSVQTLDSVKVGEEILHGLKTTTHHDFGTSTTEPPSHPDMVTEPQPSPTTSSNFAPSALRSQHHARRSHLKNKQKVPARGKQAHKLLRDLMEECRDREAKHAAASGAVVALQTRHSAVKQNRAAADQVLQQELARLRARTAYMEKSEQQLIDAKQQETQAADEFKALQIKNRNTEKELEHRVSLARQEGAQLKQEQEELEAELAYWNHLKETADQQIQEAESLIEQRHQFKNQVEATRAERNKIYAEMNQLGTAVIEAKAELDRQNRALVKQQELAATILKEKDANDQLEATKYRSFQEEFVEVKKQLKELEELAADIQANPEKAKIDEEIAIKVELTKACQRELEELNLENEVVQAELKERIKARDERKALVAMKEQLDADIACKRLAIRDRDAILETNRLTAMARSETARKLRIYQEGAALLKATADKEQQLDVAAALLKATAEKEQQLDMGL